MTMSDATAAVAPAAWTEHRILCALYDHFAVQSWYPLTQLTLNVLRDPSEDADLLVPMPRRVGTRRIDMLAVRRAAKKGIGEIERLAIEVKVSRGDLRADLANPAKQEPWRQVAHRHAYAVPEGMAAVEEIPAESGVLTVAHRSGMDVVKWARRAPYSEAPVEMPAQLVIALAARTARAEARIKGLSRWGPDRSDDPEELRANLARLERENRKLMDQVIRERESTATWRAAYAATDGLPCWACGQPVKPVRIRSYGFVAEWRHVKPAHNAPCAEQRRTLALERAREEWEQLDEDMRAYRSEQAKRMGADPVDWALTVDDVGPREDEAAAAYGR
jgi:hypothetical protein